MSFPRYPKHKDSGVEWLGEVPEHWSVVPCRAIVREQTAKNEGVSCESYLSVMANVGVIPYEEKGDVGNKKPEDLSKCKLVSKGDFVINSMNYGIGSYGISAYDGVCSPVYIVLTPRLDVVESRFAYRIFENRAFQSYAQSFGNGILAHRCAINWDILKPIGTPVPPMSEQRSILAFLDRETAKIDALIAEQQRLIELLQEKRQAVISHAVTKGLNPDAPMKDSGIEWLGEVPEHWEIVPFANAVTFQEGPGIMAADFLDEGIPLLRLSGAQGRWASLEGCNYLDPVKVSKRWSHFRLDVGDLLISGSASMGTVCEIGPETAGAVPYTGLIRLTGKSGRIQRDFLRHVVVSSLFITQIEHLRAGATIQHFGPTHLRAVKIALPPANEQAALSAYLEHQASSTETLIGSATKVIVLLQERRSALISAAVTGQIDVRGLAGSEAA